MDWTVLQHLTLVILLARRVYNNEAEVVAYAAAHDLHEAYLPDIVRPLKQRLPAYVAMEERWEAHVHTSLGLSWPPSDEVRKKVKAVDDRAVPIEAVLCGHPHADHYAHHQGGPPDPSDLDARSLFGNPEIGPPFFGQVVRKAIDDWVK
jgi:hypothetical protein